MSLGKGLAIAGVWLGVGAACIAGQLTGAVTAMCAMLATLMIVVEG